jgi:hypothetical protein
MDRSVHEPIGERTVLKYESLSLFQPIIRRFLGNHDVVDTRLAQTALLCPVLNTQIGNGVKVLEITRQQKTIVR